MCSRGTSKGWTLLGPSWSCWADTPFTSQGMAACCGSSWWHTRAGFSGSHRVHFFTSNKRHIANESFIHMLLWMEFMLFWLSCICLWMCMIFKYIYVYMYSCLENPMDGGAWWAAVHGVAKSLTRLSDFTFTFHFHALEKEMATHSSVLALRIPGTGEPGGLPSMGSHRVGHNWSDSVAAAHIYVCVCVYVHVFTHNFLTPQWDPSRD